MQTLDAITTRRSIPKTDGPAPEPARIERILQAAVMAPNHHLTEPWRFIVLQDAALDGLGEAFAETAADLGRNVAAARALPATSPVVIVVVDRSGLDHHVPATDEHYAVGMAMQNLLLAAHDDGLGAMIRTGVHVTSARVRDLLGIEPEERIAGFVHLGHVPVDAPVPSTSRRTPATERTSWLTTFDRADVPT